MLTVAIAMVETGLTKVSTSMQPKTLPWTLARWEELKKELGEGPDFIYVDVWATVNQRQWCLSNHVLQRNQPTGLKVLQLSGAMVVSMTLYLPLQLT